MFFKTDAERAAKQAAKARQDAGEAGASAATGARNMGAAALATLAAVIAPQDDKKGRRHARRTRAKALKAADKHRAAATKAAHKARDHGAKAAGHGRKELDRRSERAGGALSAYAGAAGTVASDAGHRATDALKEKGGHAAEVARRRTSDTAHAFGGKAGPVAHSAAQGAGHAAGAGAALLAALAAAAREKADETRARAVAGFDQGLDTAVPRAQHGVAAVGPRVDQFRDVINEELLPKLQALLGDVQTGKDKALARRHGPRAATGAPKKRKRKGGVLIALGLLTAAGAGVAYWLSQQSKSPAADPWAQAAAGPARNDPWAATAPTAESPGTPAADLGADDLTATEPLADAHLSDGELAEGQAQTTSTTTGDMPHMLGPDEIDALGSDEGVSVEEQGEGQSPTEEIEVERAKGDVPLTVERAKDGEDPDTPRA